MKPLKQLDSKKLTTYTKAPRSKTKTQLCVQTKILNLGYLIQRSQNVCHIGLVSLSVLDSNRSCRLGTHRWENSIHGWFPVFKQKQVPDFSGDFQ